MAPSRAIPLILSAKRVNIFYTWHIWGTSNLEKLRNQEITFKMFQVYFFIHRRITLLAILWIRSSSTESSPDGKREIESDAVGASGRIGSHFARAVFTNDLLYQIVKNPNVKKLHFYIYKYRFKSIKMDWKGISFSLLCDPSLLKQSFSISSRKSNLYLT